MDQTSISEAEALIMQLLWEKNPRSAEEICQALCEQQQWQVSTVKTLLNRLLNKGAIRADKQSRYFLYSPVLQKEVWLQQESQGFLNRLFQGRLAPLVAHFSQQQNLSAQDIADIKKIIQELEK